MASERITLGRPSPDGQSIIEQHPITTSIAVFDVERQQYLNKTLIDFEAIVTGGASVNVVGDLNDLSTSDNSTLVAAINEVYSRTGSGGGG